MVQKKTMPGLGEVPSDVSGMRQWLIRVKEILERREGVRGSADEKVLTWGDVADAGIIKSTSVANQRQVVSKSGTTVTGDGLDATLLKSIESSSLFRRLSSAINDISSLKKYPEELRQLITRSITQEARQRGADIQHTEEKIQTLDQSLSYKLDELSASLGDASAGVKQLSASFSDQNQALATKIDEVSAQIDSVGLVDVQQALEAAVFREDGLYGQYTVSMNIKDSAGNVTKHSAFGMRVEETSTGEELSTFIIQADKLAFSAGDPANPVTPFGVDASGVTVNGQLKVGSLTIGEMAENAYVPSVNNLGSFSTPPATAGLKKNCVYKNMNDGNTYVLDSDNGSWTLWLESGVEVTVVIESSNGTVFRVGQGTETILKARVFRNGEEMTSVLPDSGFRWWRVSQVPQPYPNDHTTWNNLHQAGYKQITVNVDDVYAQATFRCDVTF